MLREGQRLSPRCRRRAEAGTCSHLALKSAPPEVPVCTAPAPPWVQPLFLLGKPGGCSFTLFWVTVEAVGISSCRQPCSQGNKGKSFTCDAFYHQSRVSLQVEEECYRQ